MTSYEHLPWLQVVGVNETRLVDPGRMSQLVKALRDPINQRPSTIMLIGRNAKNAALEDIFPDNHAFESRSCEGITTLRVDNESAGSAHPIFFAESSPDQAISWVDSSDTESFPLQWAEETTRQTLCSLLHARLLCLFTDLFFIFADDFANFDQVIRLLESWATAGSASVFNQVRSRVVIVRCEDEVSVSPTYDILRMENLQQGLHQESLKEFFSSIKVLHLAAEQKTPLAGFRRLKELLRRELEEMRRIRQNLGCLFSATHLSHFFRMAVAHTATSLNQPFDFVLASRRGNEVQPDFEHHITRFLELGLKHKASQDTLMTFVASGILLDAYSPKMHGKKPSANQAT